VCRVHIESRWRSATGQAEFLDKSASAILGDLFAFVRSWNFSGLLLCRSYGFVAVQYEIPFKLSMTTFQITMMAITPAIASHKARHPWCNFSVFMPKVRSKLRGCGMSATP